MLKSKELMDQSIEQLEDLELQTREQLFHLINEKRTGKLEKAHEVSHKRKDIARVLTVLSAKRRQQSAK